MVSGMNARGIARLQTALAPFHFNVMAGGGAGASDGHESAGEGRDSGSRLGGRRLAGAGRH